MRIREWLSLPLPESGPNRQKRHAKITEGTAIFLGFLFVFVFTECFKNVLKIRFDQPGWTDGELWLWRIALSVGLVVFLSAHAIVFVRLLSRFVEVDLRHSWGDWIRFGSRQLGRLLTVFCCHLLVIVWPCIYFETNRPTSTGAASARPGLAHIDFTIDYWNYAITDILLLISVSVLAIYIKRT